MLRLLSLLYLCLLCLPPAHAQEVTTVYVGNQGNFSDANGSVTVYDVQEGSARQILANLGSLVQSVTLFGDVGYVASNTASAIDVFDRTTEARTAQIPAVSSPRYLEVVADGKAYVTNLGGFDGSPSTVTILDLTAPAVAGTIPVGSNPEDIALAAGRVYVANSGFGADSTLTVIDPATDAVLGTIDLDCDGPRHLAVDGEGEVWVACTGQTVYSDDFTQIIRQTNGAVVVLEGATGIERARFALDVQVGAASAGQDLYFDAASDQLFVVHGTELLVFDTAANTRGDAIQLAGTEPVGAVAYDGEAGRLYAARIPDFASPGFVTIHDGTGAEVGRFPAGVAPTHLSLVRRVEVATEPSAPFPGRPALGVNYPNPFLSITTIPYEVRQAGPVRVAVYDLLGQEVAVLVDEVRAAGPYTVRWAAGGHPSGIYLVRLQSGGHVATRRLTLLK